MYRRQFLRDLPLAIVSTASLPRLLEIAANANSKSWVANTPQEEIIAALVDMIIPKTSTPGALDAGVPAFMLQSLDEVVPPKRKEDFFRMLEQFSSNCITKYGQPFNALSESDKKVYLTELMLQKDPFFLEIRRWTLTGYFTSQEGMTQSLHYKPMPGKYEACIDVTPETKAEASYF
ncbi:MAG: gluconate 2-dehydrogenase subunit 3 family protein [Saprospiraceae bacterium]|nr:gluconate 2-dehydrogenase subunit 3 family protein [Saprospiraceae bacterium]